MSNIANSLNSGPRNAVLAYIKVDGSGAVTSGKLSTTL